MGVTIHGIPGTAASMALTDYMEIDRETAPGVWTSYKMRLQALKDYFDTVYSAPVDPAGAFQSVISILNAPPGAPTAGDRYLVGTAPTGAFAGNANKIAEWNGASWDYTDPIADYTVEVTSTLTTYRYNGTAWLALPGVAVLHNGNKIGTHLIVGTNTAFNLQLKTNNVIRAQIASNGVFYVAGNTMVGHISATPTARLQARGIDGTSANFAFKAEDSGGVAILAVRNDGRIGIGTTSPAAVLNLSRTDLSGSTDVLARIDGYVNGIIDIRANGQVGFGAMSSYNFNFETYGASSVMRLGAGLRDVIRMDDAAGGMMALYNNSGTGVAQTLLSGALAGSGYEFSFFRNGVTFGSNVNATAAVDVRGQVVSGNGSGSTTANDAPFYAVRQNAGGSSFYTGLQFAFEVGGGYWGIGHKYGDNSFQFLSSSTALYTFGYGAPTGPTNKFVMDMGAGYFAAGLSTAGATFDGQLSTLAAGNKVIRLTVNAGADEVFNIDDNRITTFDKSSYVQIKGSNGYLRLISNGGVNPEVSFEYNNAANQSGRLFGNGASMLWLSPAIGITGLDIGSFNPTGSMLWVKGRTNDNTQNVLKVTPADGTDYVTWRNDKKTIYSQSVEEYYGDPNTDGTIRRRIDTSGPSNAIVWERRDAGVYVSIGSFS